MLVPATPDQPAPGQAAPSSDERKMQRWPEQIFKVSSQVNRLYVGIPPGAQLDSQQALAALTLWKECHSH